LRMRNRSTGLRMAKVGLQVNCNQAGRRDAESSKGAV
jgi:hypothetical protein